jgi:hypothetical protein
MVINYLKISGYHPVENLKKIIGEETKPVIILDTSFLISPIFLPSPPEKLIIDVSTLLESYEIIKFQNKINEKNNPEECIKILDWIEKYSEEYGKVLPKFLRDEEVYIIKKVKEEFEGRYRVFDGYWKKRYDELKVRSNDISEKKISVLRMEKIYHNKVDGIMKEFESEGRVFDGAFLGENFAVYNEALFNAMLDYLKDHKHKWVRMKENEKRDTDENISITPFYIEALEKGHTHTIITYDRDISEEVDGFYHSALKNPYKFSDEILERMYVPQDRKIYWSKKLGRRITNIDLKVIGRGETVGTFKEYIRTKQARRTESIS